MGLKGAKCPCTAAFQSAANNIFRKDYAEISLARLQAAVDAKKLDVSAPVTAEVIQAAGLIRRVKDGVRVLGNGELTAKIDLSVAGATKSAVAAIEKAGGSATVLNHKKGPRTGKTAVS